MDRLGQRQAYPTVSPVGKRMKRSNTNKSLLKPLAMFEKVKDKKNPTVETVGNV